MKLFPRRGAMGLLLALPLLGACASDACIRLALADQPETTPPLVMPAGVAAIPEGGELRIPEADTVPAAAPGGCLAKPPMTLPPEALLEPEEGEAESEATEADDDAGGAAVQERD